MSWRFYGLFCRNEVPRRDCLKPFICHHHEEALVIIPASLVMPPNGFEVAVRLTSYSHSLVSVFVCFWSLVTSNEHIIHSLYLEARGKIESKGEDQKRRTKQKFDDVYDSLQGHPFIWLLQRSH